MDKCVLFVTPQQLDLYKKFCMTCFLKEEGAWVKKIYALQFQG